MMQKLNENSDVYSFGVLMLELLIGRGPIQRENHIARERKVTMDKEKDLLNIFEFLDPTIGLDVTLTGFEKFENVLKNQELTGQK
ncbi:hypothetical protein Patl1_33042 [Pistacia atlantica]|uniref:Uncharacterized protein n=1 Tax=Pistacia atlantica TaxID=434234 RepID=A0ACC1ANQ3_9ROSI|nr:hypothetical protein Patl1_33042 [Pistacia atlantica]